MTTTNIEAFLELAEDEDYLNDLQVKLIGEGYEGTYKEGLQEGIVNAQYEIVKEGEKVIIYDHHNDDHLVISEDGIHDVVQAIGLEIEERTGGMDYDSHLAYEHAMAKDD